MQRCRPAKERGNEIDAGGWVRHSLDSIGSGISSGVRRRTGYSDARRFRRTTVEQPTATPSLPEAPPTDTPIPADTPILPTPTATSTHAELAISQLSWNTDEVTDPAGRGLLVLLLLEVSDNHPLLFEALLQKPWLNPDDVPLSYFRVNDAIGSGHAVSRLHRQR